MFSRNEEQDDVEEKTGAPEVKEALTVENFNTKATEGAFVYNKTNFETPKGFGQGL